MPCLPQNVPLSARIAALLRDRIQSGEWNSYLPSEHDLCEDLKVSRVTLRMALAGLQREGLIHSSQGRRRRIAGAQGLPRPVPPRRVIVLLSRIPMHLLMPKALFWIDALRERLAEDGYRLEFKVCQASHKSGRSSALENLVRGTNAAGWVLFQSTEPMQRWFSERKIPCVVAGSRFPGVKLPTLDIDYRTVCRHAAGLLLSRGHERLALLVLTPVHAGDLESEKGFHEALHSRKGVRLRKWVIHHDGTPEDICRKLDEVLGSPQPPTGFLVSRATPALTVASYLRHQGLRLGRDVAVISRDDSPHLDSFIPPVARYAFKTEVFSRNIIRLVSRMAAGIPLRPVEHRIIPSFVAGETLSCGEGNIFSGPIG